MMFFMMVFFVFGGFFSLNFLLHSFYFPLFHSFSPQFLSFHKKFNHLFP